MTLYPCSVAWCVALAEPAHARCALHRRYSDLSPEELTPEDRDNIEAREPILPCCDDCNGSGECIQCDGEGTTKVQCDDCHHEHDCDCNHCDSSGECPTCDGSGHAPQNQQIVAALGSDAWRWCQQYIDEQLLKFKARERTARQQSTDDGSGLNRIAKR